VLNCDNEEKYYTKFPLPKKFFTSTRRLHATPLSIGFTLSHIRTFQIEPIVTYKHDRAWKRCLLTKFRAI